MREWARRAFWLTTPTMIAHFALAPLASAQQRQTMFAREDDGNNYRHRFGNRFRRPNIFSNFSGAGKPQVQELSYGGLKRCYYIYQPSSAKIPAPLVLAFHGGGGNAEGVDVATGGLAKVADKYGFIVVYPDAIDKHWNDGRPDLTKENQDDVGFIAKIISDLETQKIIDGNRIYATGISNGGFFSQYLALQLKDKIAAVASVAASVSKVLHHQQTSPIPIMLILGTKDPLVPWNGGFIGGRLLRHKRGEVLAARESLNFWLAQNKNVSSPEIFSLPDTDPHDGTTVKIERYGHTDSKNQVVFYEILGGGHTWPSGQVYLPKSIIGPVCRDFNGNETIWEFFSHHSLR